MRDAFLAAALAVVLSSGSARAAEPEAGPVAVVVGQGDPALDVPAVQAAVSGGGSVLLRGTFRFGPTGSVAIARDVSIRGEEDRDGNPATTIVGGWNTFATIPPPRPVLAPGPRVSIRGLSFTGASSQPILVRHASEVEIVGNRIAAVTPLPLPAPLPPFLRHAGILIGAPALGFVPGAITGRVVVAGNRIDLAAADPALTSCTGIMIIFTTGAEAEVRGNTVTGCSGNAIEAIDNYRDAAGRGSLAIGGNTLTTPAAAAPYPVPALPNGIVAGWFYDRAAGSDPSRNPSMLIAWNRIEVNATPGSGVVVLTDGAVVHRNRVHQGGGSAGAFVGGAGNLLAENRIGGAAQAGILVKSMGPGYSPPRQNQILHNEVEGLAAGLASYVFAPGADDNLLVGRSGTILDQGAGNVVRIGEGEGWHEEGDE